MRQSMFTKTCLMVGVAYVLLLAAPRAPADYGTPEGGGDLDAQLQARSLDMVNELSNRRRLHLLFTNPQSPNRGVQKSYVNVGEGNLSFIQRDLVRVSHIPLIAGRVYDSGIVEGADFGPGWKFAMGEELIRRSGNNLEYVDANNSQWRLRDTGNTLQFEDPAPPGRLEAAREGQDITLRDERFTRSFVRAADRYLLSRVEDRAGNAIEYVYEGGLLAAIRTSQGRSITIERSANGRIVAISDDAGQRVEYAYTPGGLLTSSSLMSGAVLRYRYDAGQRLAAVIDPRGVSVLTAAFDDQGRASEVSVLGNPYRFRYEPGRTTVSDARDVSSSFAQNAAGMTVAVTDNTGAVTKLVLDQQGGDPTAFEVNGVPLATFAYSQKGQLQGISHSGADSQSETVFSYSPSGALEAIHTDGTEVARFGYDRQHRLSDAWTTQTGALTFDWTDDGQPKKLQFENTAINIDSDAHGRVTHFSRGYGQSLRVGYDERDRVISIDRGASGASAYTYGVDKFRTSSIYDGVDTVIYAYDPAGNVRGFAYENADGSSRQDEYFVGERNELQKVKSSHNPEFEFEYDTLGRATRVLAAGRELQIDYDEQSRVTKTTLDGRVTMEADYAQETFDVAHHVDDRTFRSRATQRPGSGIIGSIHEIIYTRPLYTPWQAVAFDAEMNRFVLRPLADAHPERLLIDGFARRNLPLTPESSHGAITHLDKPSSALFVPPELVSANCFVCNVVIFGHVLTINDQYSATLNPGEYGVFKSSAFATGCQYETGPPPPFLHTLDYDDGDLSNSVTYPPFYATAHAFDAPGSFEPVASMKCACGIFGLSWASADVDVEEPDPDPSCSGVGLDFWARAYVKLIQIKTYERGTSIFCDVGDTPLPYLPLTTSGSDVCKISIPKYQGDLASVHTHPFFLVSPEPVFCHGDWRNISTASAANSWNAVGESFSDADEEQSSELYPGYLKTPSGIVKRCPGDC